MAIKQPETLSRADFDEAVVHLRLNMSEVAKETGIPRTYLSEFRNGDRKLRPEILAKLRDYFEGKGLEFDTAPDHDTQYDETSPMGRTTSHPRIAAGTVMYLPIRGDIADDRIGAVMSEIARNDVRAAALCNKRVERVPAWIGGEGRFDEATQDELRELFALFAANYVLVRYLTGKDNPLAAPPAKSTLHEVLLDVLNESTERAGVAPPETPTPTTKNGDDTETEAKPFEVQS